MRRVSGWILALAAGLLAWPAAAHAQVEAGVAAVDASWHVGASAGQYASDCAQDGPSDNCTFAHPSEGTYDPTAHSVRRGSSYGIQSRLSVRALVIEGPDGQRVAIAKTDLYIPQDLVYRRAAQLMEEDGCGIGAETFTMSVTHNHSSPFYSSTSWGAWAFQDVFDVRFFNYMAERMAQAVAQACDSLVPVRVGAAVGQFDKTHRHSFGPAIADDGTPAGYPHSDTDHDLTVIRFDDVSDPGNPEPLANLVNFSLHPEFLSGNDLITADYLGPLERMLDRRTGALTVWTQGAVGTAEPERSTYHSVHERLEFSHQEYAQAEYGARLMADAATGAWQEAGRPSSAVPFETDFAVEIKDAWYPGPFSHPYPGVSNCRADPAFNGDPRIPIAGLPTCQDVSPGLEQLSGSLGLPPPPDFVPGTDPGLDTDDFQALGIPVPENYSAPSYTGLEEDINVHLQGIRLGEIYLPVCSCEQWFDQSRNLETRTDQVEGNEYLGFDWSAQCTPRGDGTYAPDGSGTGTWSCPNPGDPSQALPPVSDHRYQRMRAQVRNPANGWNDPENAAEAESEPFDPTEIKGNYTHDDRCGPTALTPGDQACGAGETSPSASLGYELTVPISMANDYNGYIATYREYQRGDHYRKSLTGWGPHSSDYMSTRLAYIGRQLKNPGVVLPPDMVAEQILEPKVAADLTVNEARAQALGETGGGLIAAFDAALPDNGGDPEPISQPQDVERFGAALFTWNGGDNYTDNPQVAVERLVGGEWQPFADQSGELPVTLEFPSGQDVPVYLSGGEEWEWTAHFEAFVAPFPTGSPSDAGAGEQATPEGTYRFVVDGLRREGGEAMPYHVESNPFSVEPWSGIEVDDFRLEPDDTMSFVLGPRGTYTVPSGGGREEDEEKRPVGVIGNGPEIPGVKIGPIDYPDSYASPARFIDHHRVARRDPAAPADSSQLEWFCFTCSFRPWVDQGDAESAEVAIVDVNDGSVDTVPATEQGGRWATERALHANELAYVLPGGVRDSHGNFNGAGAGPLFLGSEPPQPPAQPPAEPPIGELPGGDPAAGEPGPCAESQTGTAAADTIVGSAGGELQLGLAGDDLLQGADGDDCLFGGPGNDELHGQAGGDQVLGEEGRDGLHGGPDPDRLDGGGGADVVEAGAGGDEVESRGNGRDKVRCGPGEDTALVGKIDRVRGCEHVERGP